MRRAAGSATGRPNPSWATLRAVNLREADLAELAQTEEVAIETQSAAGDIHHTTIWIVVDGQDAFIRSVRGKVARWYREALARPDVALLVERRRIPVHLVPAPDADAVARCSAALTAKYGADPALGSMLRPATLPTTLRVVASA